MTLINSLALTWVTVCGIQDYLTKEVSNWLTLTAIVFSLVARLAGWVSTSWTFTIVVSATVLVMWNLNQFGGADAKGWIVFALVGEWLVVGAALGMLLWFGITKATRMYPDGRTPGYPGYALGAGLILFVQNQTFFTG
jgi:Flp pilus assembly protein protease CpaA